MHDTGMHINKISLSTFDSKRWIEKNGIETLAYGHRYLYGGKKITDDDFRAVFALFENDFIEPPYS